MKNLILFAIMLCFSSVTFASDVMTVQLLQQDGPGFKTAVRALGTDHVAQDPQDPTHKQIFFEYVSLSNSVQINCTTNILEEKETGTDCSISFDLNKSTKDTNVYELKNPVRFSIEFSNPKEASALYQVDQTQYGLSPMYTPQYTSSELVRSKMVSKDGAAVNMYMPRVFIGCNTDTHDHLSSCNIDVTPDQINLNAP